MLFVRHLQFLLSLLVGAAIFVSLRGVLRSGAAALLARVHGRRLRPVRHPQPELQHDRRRAVHGRLPARLPLAPSGDERGLARGRRGLVTGSRCSPIRRSSSPSSSASRCGSRSRRRAGGGRSSASACRRSSSAARLWAQSSASRGSTTWSAATTARRTTSATRAGSARSATSSATSGRRSTSGTSCCPRSCCSASSGTFGSRLAPLVLVALPLLVLPGSLYHSFDSPTYTATLEYVSHYGALALPLARARLAAGRGTAPVRGRLAALRSSPASRPRTRATTAA